MRIAGIVLIALLCGAAYAQTPDGQPSFDVASIRVAPSIGTGGGRIMIGMSGGPGTPDPGRYECNNCNLSMLMTKAYDVAGYQISIPSALRDAVFEITAKVPAGATKDEFRLMLQNLLAERFKMTVHREKKEMQIYELVVAKGGPKMTESAPEPAPEAGKDEGPNAPPPPPPPGGRGPLPPGKDGFPALPKARPGRPMMFFGLGRARLQANTESMADFAKTLADLVGKPVTDATGLTAKYDFTLTWDGAGGPGRGLPEVAPPSSAGGAVAAGNTPLAGATDAEVQPTIFAAVQGLGLKLEQKKGQVDVIVVDHAEKVPTEN
jgi:uncharacterized protein (TIGR03435 family)